MSVWSQDGTRGTGCDDGQSAVFVPFRPSILERCILKVSTSSVAVGTDDLDKRSVKSENGNFTNSHSVKTTHWCFYTKLLNNEFL